MRTPPSQAKEDRVQIVTKDEFLFLDMKIRWTPEGELHFGVFRKAGQKLKYIGKERNHTPGTLCTIPSGALNRLEKLTSQKPSLHSEGVYKVYPDHANALRKAGLAPLDFPTMGDLWKMQDKKWILRTKKNLTSTKRKQKCLLLCCLLTLFLNLYPQGHQQTKKEF